MQNRPLAVGVSDQLLESKNVCPRALSVATAGALPVNFAHGETPSESLLTIAAWALALAQALLARFPRD
jgi:hypothetical protein